MAKIDLHVHSKYSEHPSDWFLQRIGAKESYTEPEFIRSLANKRGMDFVTITDHNRIDGVMMLKDKYPEETITGVETTTYFPEDRCKIHILIFGFNESQFTEIQKLRVNIFDLRDYIRDQNLAHSVAHANYSVNKKLTLSHIEKLILMFDVFEGINGGRNFLSNDSFEKILRQLTPQHIERLYDKHCIEPISDNPWNKAFTAGSDDHSGQFIGKTYTLAPSNSTDELLMDLKNKRTTPEGRHNDFKSLAFTVYKIAYDFSTTKGSMASNSLINQFAETIFYSRSLSLSKKIRYRSLKTFKKRNGNRIKGLFFELLEEVRKLSPEEIDERLEIVYEKTSDIADEFLKKVFQSIEGNVQKGDVSQFIMNFSSFMPGLFLTLPFFTTLRHMFQSRKLIEEMKQSFSIPYHEEQKKILWFTDTIEDKDISGEIFLQLSWFSYRNDKQVKIVTADKDAKKQKKFPPDAIFLPTIFDTHIPQFESFNLHIPSLLKSIDILQKEEPTEIYISTPGPIGLLGLLMAILLNVKFVGIFQPDVLKDIERSTEDQALLKLAESYSKWFYSYADEIKVYSENDLAYLENKGFDRPKIDLFPIGIDHNHFTYSMTSRKSLKKRFGFEDGYNLVYKGGNGDETPLDFLLEIHTGLNKKGIASNLFVLGDEPRKPGKRPPARQNARTYFIDPVDKSLLPEIYSGSDIFLFLRASDGKDLMAAQACELPAVVSDRAGAKNIIVEGVTGFTAKHKDTEDWIKKIEAIILMKSKDESNFQAMQKAARQNILKNYSWTSVSKRILENR